MKTPKDFIPFDPNRGRYWESPGSWYEIDQSPTGVGGFRTFCCSCGLTHLTNIVVDEHGKMFRRAWPDPAATAETRKAINFDYQLRKDSEHDDETNR